MILTDGVHLVSTDGEEELHLRNAGERFREAIASDYMKDGMKVSCSVLAESLGKFHEVFRNQKEGK